MAKILEIAAVRAAQASKVTLSCGMVSDNGHNFVTDRYNCSETAGDVARGAGFADTPDPVQPDSAVGRLDRAPRKPLVQHDKYPSSAIGNRKANGPLMAARGAR